MEPNPKIPRVAPTYLPCTIHHRLIHGKGGSSVAQMIPSSINYRCPVSVLRTWWGASVYRCIASGRLEESTV